MGERLDLSAPTSGRSGITSYEVMTLVKDRPARRVAVQLLADNGDTLLHVWDDDTLATGVGNGMELMRVMNRRNYSGSNDSEQRQILNQLVTDGVIVGTISGTHD